MCLTAFGPECFKPRWYLKGKPVYRDLSSHKLLKDEKNWLMQKHLGLNSAGDESNEGMKQSELNTRYNLNQSFWKNNIKTFKKNGSCNDGTGNEHLVSWDEADKMAKYMLEMKLANTLVNVVEIRRMVSDAAKLTAITRGKPLPVGWQLSERAFKSHCDYFKVRIRTAIGITDAREKSCKCPLMSYQWYLICMAMSNGLPAHRKWNIDASTFVFNTVKGKVCIVDEKDYSDVELDQEFLDVKRLKEVKSKNVKASLPFGIKWMNLINAAGENGSFVGVIAVKEMPDDQFYYEEVNDIGLTSKIGDKGHLYFSKTRAGTATMWQHYFKTIVCPTIKESNDVHYNDDCDNIPLDERHPTDPPTFKNFLSSDGEDIIAAQGYNSNIIWHFSVLDIIYARIGAALTGIHQACDRCFTFKGSKNKIKVIEKNDEHKPSNNITRSVTNAFKNLKINFPMTQVTAEYQKNMIYAVSLLVTVLRGIVNPNHNQTAFQCCGQHVENSSTTDTVDFNVMMNQCWTKISSPQLELMQEKAPIFIDMIRRTGMISHSVYAEHGISGGSTTINRDDLTHIRASSHIINCDSAIKKFESDIRKQSDEYRKEIRDIKDKANNIKIAQKFVAKYTKAQAKVQSKAAAKELTKARQAEYKNLNSRQKRKRDEEDLTAAELEREIKLQKKLKANAKRQQQDQKLQNARQILAAIPIET